MMSTARIASTAGWLTLAAILISEVVVPSLLIGLPPTGSIERTVVKAYYGHEALLPLGLVAIATIIGFIVFKAFGKDRRLPITNAWRESIDHG